LRLAKRLNHDGLAKITKLLDKQEDKGINRTTIRGYEVGMYKPGARELRLLSEALDVSPSVLLLGFDTGDNLPKTGVATGAFVATRELELFITAMFLAPLIPNEGRHGVYDVVSAMARMHLGEETFRAESEKLKEISSLFTDLIYDYLENRQLPDIETLPPEVKEYLQVAVDRLIKIKGAHDNTLFVKNKTTKPAVWEPVELNKGKEELS
jgi:hypothetical protein